MPQVFDNPDDWFSGTNKTIKKSKTHGGVPYIPRIRPKTNPKTAATNAIKGINKKLPEVMVKITGASKGGDRAQAHLDYIGRNGQVEIQDEQGNSYQGNTQKQLIKLWEVQGMPPTHATGARKEALHFVFSMPKGTNPAAMKQAVKNLVQEEFTDHHYFLAQHLDTDSPHVHVLINATSHKGERLNPRKDDLFNLRLSFVQKLKEQGIQAVATKRIHRFKDKNIQVKGEYHKAQRLGQITKSPTTAQKRDIEKTHKAIESSYKHYAVSLDSEHGELKQEIGKMLKGREKGRGR